MTRKLTLARRFIMAGVCSAFVFVGIASLSAQELTLTDEDMQYNAGMKSITVDGDISDWSGLPVKKAIPFEQGGELVLFEEYSGGTWSGPEDHTSAVSFAWDTDNLYVGVVVTDDTHQNPGNGWNGDSIQMVFANAAQDTVTHLYNYALSDGGDIVIHNERGPGGTELAVTRDEDTTTTSYEIKVPADSLGLDAFELDMQIGIGLCINDGDTDDGQGGQKGWSGWGPYAAVYGKTASATGLVTLTAKHDAVPGRPMVTKLVDFGSDDETINGVTGQPSPEPWISITKLVMDEAFDLGDAITITARDDGFNPNNPAPPNADDEYDGILVPESARNDYFFKITDAAGTEARMQIEGLPAGKYNITVFEGRETDSSQFAKIWTSDAEPDAENTGNFAKGGATVEVTVAAGQSLWYKHLEDNTGGVSGMMIRQTSQPGASPLLVDLVSHWPLDEISGEVTPDVIGGRDMTLTNMDDSNIVEGKVGKAFSFSNGDQTLLSYLSEGEDDDLPINKHDSFTISFWSKVAGTGQNDLRLFSESNTEGNNNPLFNIGTKNNGSNGTIDIYIRGAGPTVGHIFSTAEPFDGEWHHVVFVQNDLERSIYVDGELDDLEIAAKPESGWDDINATTIGGILRGNASHWVSGDIDEVALWKRALSDDEIADVFSSGIPSPGGATQLVPGMIAYWSFDSASEIDGEQVVVDMVSGIEGVVNGETSSAEGHVGGAIDFGENPAGNWVSIEPDEGDSWLTPVSDANQLTVAFWQKNHSTPNTSSFWLGAASANNGQRNAQAHVPWGGGTIFWDTAGCCGGDTRINAAWDGDWLEWNHYVFIKNEDLKQIYINGELFHEGNNNAAFKDDWTVSGIGSNNSGGSNVPAVMDEFGVWARGLTADEIATIYNNGAGASLMTQDSGAIALPYISKFTKGAGGFTVQLTDEATVGVDPDSVVVSVDGAEVTVDKSKAEGVTTLNYSTDVLLEPGSEHIMNLSYVGTDGVNRSFEKSFKVKAYSLIDPAIRVPESMKGESGFLVYATQISTGQGVGNLHGNRWRDAEKQIQGGYHLPDSDEPYINEADPDSFEGWTYYPEIVEVVNQNQDAPTGIGNFQANDKGNSTDREDEPITGIPGWGDSTDGIASEYLALLELPAGSHTFGVNSDDGFSASFAGNFLDMEQQQVGLFDGGRGAATSTFIVHVQEPGLYPFRVSWWEGGGGANVEIFSTVGKDKVLINDPDVEGSIKAWAPEGAVTDEQVTERAGTGRAYISGLSPNDGAFAATKTIELTVVNGSVSTLDEGSVKFTYDGEAVSHSVVKDGDARVITYDATSGGNGKHTAKVELADSDGNKRSVEWSFTLADPLIPGMPNPIAFWDFNFNQNAATAVDHVSGRIGDVMGGVYIDDTPTGEEGDYAMDFKAAGAHVNVADGEFLNILSTIDKVTISFWQKNYSIPSTASFKGVSPSSGSGRGFFAHVPWSNGHIYWDTAGCCDGNTQRINADANDIGGWPGEALDTWHHFVFVKDGSEKSIWVDGEFFHEGTNTNPLPMDMTKLVIGADEGGAAGVHGAIDDFAIFASALNEDQIIALSEGDRGILPKEPGYPLLAGVSPSGLSTGEDAIQVTLVKRVDAIADTSLTVNGESLDVDVSVEGNTTTLTATSNPSKIGINSATVSYNGREHAWSYFNYGEPLKDGGENLIASWDFESGTKDSVYGLEGELLNDAALVEMDGRKVLDLSGSGSATMKVVTEGLLDLTATSDQVTVSFWQKFKSIGNTSSFNGQSSGASHTRGFHAHAPWGSGAIYWDTVGCCNGSTQRINKDNPGFDYKQWHHLAFVKDKGKKSIWVNGQLFHQGNNSAALPMDMNSLWVGSTTDGGGSINGAIDDFKVFAQALTGGQIAGQYFQGQAIVINISEQPTSATATLGWDHVFSVKVDATADGEPLADSQLNYQWYLNGAAIDGANGSTYRTGLLSAADEGKYSVTINQGGVSLSSDDAVLAVAKDNSAPGLAVANATQPGLDSGGGAALRFNGGGNYVSVEADIVESDYTVEFWFRTEDPNAGLYCVVDQNLGAGGHDRHLHLVDGNIRVRTWSGDGIKQSTGLNLADGKWHHLAHVLGADAEGQKIYIDGEVVVEQSKDFSNFDWQKHLNFGFSNDAASQYLIGEMDELRVWEIVRTQEEIKENMNKTLTGDEDWLFAYYRFDEVGGDVLPDFLEGHDGLLMGMGDKNWVASSAPLGQPLLDGIPVPTTIQIGFNEAIRDPEIGSGGSLMFNGKGGHVALPNEFPVAMSGLEAVTVEYWFKGTSFQSAVRWQDGPYFVAGWNGMHIISSDGGTGAGIQVGDAIDGSWHHVAMTWEMDGLFTSYLDGELVDEREAGSEPLPTISSQAYLGAYMGASEFTSGQLDEVRVWSVARTEEELVQWKDKSLADGSEGLVAYYKFDEFDGNILPDSSGNGFHGQLRGVNWAVGANPSFTNVGPKGQAVPGVFEVEGAKVDSVKYLADGRTVEIVAYDVGSTANVTINGVRDTGNNEIKANTSFELKVNAGDVVFEKEEPEIPLLSIVNNGDGTVTVTFEGRLETAQTVNGPWQDTGATSPLTTTADAAMQYARAVRD